ncbi:MAG: M48 family metallopeptidase [Deltaproteobacteria bacterium]|nr:M48 family metallopeptidase [Deltaproteobacteria bacterium]
MRWFRELFLLLLLFGVCGAGVYYFWQWVSQPSDSKSATKEADVPFQVSVEGKIRKLLKREIALEAVKDKIVTNDIKKIHDRLAPHIGKLPFAIEIYVVDSPTINAVCLPGGLIIVYAGLIRILQTPEELAAVLAHEISHVIHGDVMKVLMRELGITALLTLAGGQSDAVTSRLLHRLVSTGFSRQQELDADKEGFRILSDANIDPGVFAQALRHMRKAQIDDTNSDSSDDDLGALEYLSTHPDTNDRIQNAEAASVAWSGNAQPIKIDWKRFRSRFRIFR